MKKVISFLILFSLILNMISCSSKEIKFNKESFTPYPISEKKILSIDNPKVGWLYSWKYSENDFLGIRNSPVVDDFGNAYFCSNEGGLFSISSKGNLNWRMNSFPIYNNNVHSLKDGIINNNNLYINNEKKMVKIIKSVDERDIYIGPDGVSYSFRGVKNLKTILKAIKTKNFWDLVINNSDIQIISRDFQGKIRWIYGIHSQITDERRELINIFFDNLNNIYFIFNKYYGNNVISSYGSDKQIYEIYSLTPEGKLRWNIEFPRIKFYDEFIGNFEDFLPNDLIVKDSFLLEVSKISDDGKKEEGHIKCFSINGEELWDYQLPKYKLIRKPYMILSDSTFIVPLNNYNNDRTYLLAISKDGKLLWEREIYSSHSTSPIIDNEDNIYIGLGGWDGYERYIYSFDKYGKTRWSMKQPNSWTSFETDLVLGPDRCIYYGCDNENILYCIQDTEK